MTQIRSRLSLQLAEQVFASFLQMATKQKLIFGSCAGVDGALPEGNAAMKSIFLRESDEKCREHVRRLMQHDGVIDKDHEPGDENLARFGRSRFGKNVSSQEPGTTPGLLA
jgi:hypothetical protein